MALLTERYADRLAGVLSCFDRIIAIGTLPGACYAAGMTSFPLPLRERVREWAQALAEEHAVAIEHITQAHIRKEEVVAKVLAARGEHPGLVYLISAMESCQSYKPWYDKKTGKTFLRPDTGKLCSAKTCSRQHGLQRVLVMQPAQHRLDAHRKRGAHSMPGFGIERRCRVRGRIRHAGTQRHVWAPGVVMLGPASQNCAQMGLRDRNQPIQAFAAERANQAFA